MAPSEFLKVSLAGIDSVLPAQGYTLSDGALSAAASKTAWQWYMAAAP